MLLTMEQSKYLEADGDVFRFVGQGKTSKKEKQDLKDFDESCTDLYGRHMITNYTELD